MGLVEKLYSVTLELTSKLSPIMPCSWHGTASKQLNRGTLKHSFLGLILDSDVEEFFFNLSNFWSTSSHFSGVMLSNSVLISVEGGLSDSIIPVILEKFFSFDFALILLK